MDFLDKHEAVYKCRLCGKEFRRHEIGDSMQASMFLGRMCVQSSGNNQPYEHHVCENGDIGFADLIGCRKINK